MSLLWGLETTRKDVELNARLDSAHRRMVRRMMRIKKWPHGKWADWHKRSFQRATQVISDSNCVLGFVLDESRQTWMQHIVTFRLGPRQNHLLKFVLDWRSFGWWNHQKLQNKGIDKVAHIHRTGKIRTYVCSFPTSIWSPVDMDKYALVPLNMCKVQFNSN